MYLSILQVLTQIAIAVDIVNAEIHICGSNYAVLPPTYYCTKHENLHTHSNLRRTKLQTKHYHKSRATKAIKRG